MKITLPLNKSEGSEVSCNYHNDMMVTAQIIKAKRKKGRKKNAQAAARPRGGGDNQSEETELVGAGMQKLGQII